MRRHWPALLLACLAVVLSARTAQYAVVWRSDLALWRHAIVAAPGKPRPWVNYGEALGRAGRRDDARRVWAIAQRAARLPHVQPWDRAAVRNITDWNMATLNRLEGVR